MRTFLRLMTVAALLLATAGAASARPNVPLSTTPTAGQTASSTALPAATQPIAARVAAVMAEGAAFDARPLRRGDEADTGPGSTTRPAGTGIRAAPIDFPKLAAALAIVVLLIVGSRFLFKRFFAGANAPATSRAVKVIGRTALAPRQQILLLQIGARVVVVGESNGLLSTLAQIEDPDEVARLLGQLQEEQIQRAASFGGLFGRVQKKYDDEHAPPAEPSGDPVRTQASALEEEQIGQARSELSGLVEKVRSLRSQIDR